MLSRIGLFSRRARASASSPHGYQSTGLCACCSRYGLVSFARRLAIVRSSRARHRSATQSTDLVTSKPKIANPSRLRSLPWVALLLTLLVGLSALFPRDAIRDAATLGPMPDARLERSLGYVILGPVSSMFDAMTLFSVQQIIGFTLWAIGLYVVARVLYRRPVGVKREALCAVLAFVLLIATYALA